MKFKFPFSVKNLHWTTVASEKILLAIIGIATCVAAAQYLFQMFEAREILLSDLFLLFIYVEIIGMVGAFYSTNRIPVTLPIIIAITALCRLINYCNNCPMQIDSYARKRDGRSYAIRRVKCCSDTRCSCIYYEPER